jgi:hypothetical protein
MADLCKARNIQVPVDAIDLLNRAKVYFMGADGKPVALQQVMVTWEEG